RLPIGNEASAKSPRLHRISREVATERDLFQAAGTFFELPARNAAGFARIRPITTHPFFVHDYCSWRGLMVLTGIDPESKGNDEHIVRSEDGKAAVWLGAIDDLWSAGKPTGMGGPWSESKVSAGDVSDPYLMCGYDRKSVSFRQQSEHVVTVELEVDITGMGHWQLYRKFTVFPSKDLSYEFPNSFQAYWVRAKVDKDCTASVIFDYN
ncbi:hypothetical protein N9B94_04760, partial [Verrucomicrobia bacterium]|nr:hypothetical protein [Verrucomicrobiota bacterium]